MNNNKTNITKDEITTKEYNLTFVEVLEEMLGKDSNIKLHAWYQGEHFADGHFLDCQDDCIILYSFDEDKFGMQKHGIPVLSKGLYHQKYRRVYTQPDVMRKIK